MQLTLELLKTIAPVRSLMGQPSAESRTLGLQLFQALGEKESVDFEIVHGTTSSTRVFLTHLRPGKSGGIVADAYEIADDLIAYAHATKGEVARYEEPVGKGVAKGWKIEKIEFQGHPAALVTATWVRS